MYKHSGTKVLVCTEYGGYVFSKDDKKWKMINRFLRGESVNSISHDIEGNLYAATLTEGVFLSSDEGKTWKPVNKGLHVRKVWTVEPDPHRKHFLYAGTHYGHLFRSEDMGRSWQEITGLHKAPLRKDWGIDWAYGTTGLTIHTVRVDPEKENKIFIVSSGAGLYRSDDRGETWKLLRNGVMEACPTFGKKNMPSKPNSKDSEDLKKHLETVHTCTHKIAFSRDGRIFQQNHCGVFMSKNKGETWADISPDTKRRHGFPIVCTGRNKEYIFTIPAYQGICKKHNSCIIGKLEVMRRDNVYGRWTSLNTGLPNDVHTCILRDAMSTPEYNSGEVYFGTTTGELYYSNDEGETWTSIAKGLGRIQGVHAFSLP
jgi:hypothetical protein